MISLEKVQICVVGLGYVGLPLAVEFGKKYNVTGFDIHQKRINELMDGHDRTLETSDKSLLPPDILNTQLNLRM